MGTKRLYMTRGHTDRVFTLTEQQQFDGRPVELDHYKADLLGIIVAANAEINALVGDHMFRGEGTKEKVASELDALAVAFETSLQTIKRYDRERKADAKKEAKREATTDE